jgi:hypothetical protein
MVNPGGTPGSLSHPVGRDVLGAPRDLHSGGGPAILSDGGGTPSSSHPLSACFRLPTYREHAAADSTMFPLCAPLHSIPLLLS